MDKFTKRNADGSVDIQASAAAYTRALTEWCVANEIPAEQIAAAVNTVLDRHPDTRVPTDALLSYAVAELGSVPSNFTSLRKRVHAYVTGQTEAGNLFVVKGVGGGVARFPKKNA